MVKHSGSRRCRVSVVFDGDDLSVVVMDSGRGTGPRGADGAGYGLIGMRERVELFHGDFTAGPRPEGGFRIQARLPIVRGAR